MSERWGETPAVLVVDVTRKRADPSLDTAMSRIVETAERIADLLAAARERDVPVFFSRGGKSYYTSSGADVTDDERGGWAKQNPIREESPAAARRALELAPQLAPRDDETVVTKRTPSAFFESPLASDLDALGVDTLVVTGIMTSCCVRASVTDAFAHDYHVVIPEGCVADRRPAAGAFHVAEMGEKFADVEPFESVTAYLERTA